MWFASMAYQVEDARGRSGAGEDAFELETRVMAALGRATPAPAYLAASTGPDHDKEFTASVVIAENEYGRGVGRTKKEAELKAAAAAWNALDSA